MIHEIIKIFHQYLLKHVQVSDQDMWLLPNIEAGLVSYNYEFKINDPYLMANGEAL